MEVEKNLNSQVISSSFNYSIITRTHRWPYVPCSFWGLFSVYRSLRTVGATFCFSAFSSWVIWFRYWNLTIRESRESRARLVVEEEEDIDKRLKRFGWFDSNPSAHSRYCVIGSWNTHFRLAPQRPFRPSSYSRESFTSSSSVLVDKPYIYLATVDTTSAIIVFERERFVVVGIYW